MRSVFDWNIGSRVLALGKRTLVMGVVNVTPDSFSDGGQFLDREKAVEHALRLLDETGTLEVGKSADVAIWNCERPAELVYRIGFNPLYARYFKGRTQ